MDLINRCSNTNIFYRDFKVSKRTNERVSEWGIRDHRVFFFFGRHSSSSRRGFYYSLVYFGEKGRFGSGRRRRLWLMMMLVGIMSVGTWTLCLGWYFSFKSSLSHLSLGACDVRWTTHFGSNNTYNHRLLQFKLDKQLCSLLAVKFCSQQGIFSVPQSPLGGMLRSLQEMASK